VTAGQQGNNSPRPDLPTSAEREEIRKLRAEKLRAAPRERDPEVSQRVLAKELDE